MKLRNQLRNLAEAAANSSREDVERCLDDTFQQVRNEARNLAVGVGQYLTSLDTDANANEETVMELAKRLHYVSMISSGKVDNFTKFENLSEEERSFYINMANAALAWKSDKLSSKEQRIDQLTKVLQKYRDGNYDGGEEARKVLDSQQ